MLVQVLAGLGLFLLGMALLTDGLKAVAGGGLRRALLGMAGSKWRAAWTGMAATMLVQSSSATTLATVALVSAGLLGLEQALAVIIGTTIGTTGTSWIVAAVGLRFALTPYAGALVAVGAMMRLLAQGRRAAAGLALAGFGLIFLGIEAMQVGMEAVAGGHDILANLSQGASRYPALFLAGFVATVLVQSSSATMVTALAAVAAGALDFRSATFVAIGSSLGTSVTAVLAAIGAAGPARRAAGGHLVYHAAMAVVSVAAVPFLWPVLENTIASPVLRLAAIHTAFAVLAAGLVLPMLVPFSRLVRRIVPGAGPELGGELGPLAAHAPAVAVEAARRTLSEVAGQHAGILRARLRGGPTRPWQQAVAVCAMAIVRTETHLGRLQTGPGTSHGGTQFEDVLHALDHLREVQGAIDERVDLGHLTRDFRLEPYLEKVRMGLDESMTWLQGDQKAAPEAASMLLGAAHDLRAGMRRTMIAEAAAGTRPTEAVLSRLDALAWLDTQTGHLRRAIGHLQTAD